MENIKDFILQEILYERSKELQLQFLQYISYYIDNLGGIITTKKKVTECELPIASREESKQKLELFLELKNNILDIERFRQLSSDYLTKVFNNIFDKGCGYKNIKDVISSVRLITKKGD